MPRNKLAKLVSISPQRLNHRIQQLEKQFLEPYVCLDYPSLGIESFILLYENLEEEQLKSLYKSKNIYYAIHLAGNKRYLVLTITNDVLSFCSEHTPMTAPTILPVTAYIPDNWNGFDIKPLPRKLKKRIVRNLNKKDYKILFELCKNPVASQLELSEKVKMSRKTTKEKLEKLENCGIIQKYRFSVNLPKIDLLNYVVIATCFPNEVSKVIELIKTNSYSGFIHQSYNKLIFSSISFTHKQLFDFLEKIEKSTNSKIEVYQNTGNYIINPVPDYVKEILKERSN